jgi:hypothetical protein
MVSRQKYFVFRSVFLSWLKHYELKLKCVFFHIQYILPFDNIVKRSNEVLPRNGSLLRSRFKLRTLICV